MNRRRFLKQACASVTGAYGLYRLPFAFGQESSNEIDCGTVVTRPTFTGVIDDSWYGDTNDYKAAGTPSPFISPPRAMEGHLRTKFDDYTWFGIEVPTSSSQKLPEFWLTFDIKNTGNTDPGADGVYNLILDSGQNGLFEKDHTEDSYGTKLYFAGNPFFKSFSRPTDYDWKYASAQSKLSSNPHPQLNVRIRTEILTKYSNKINFFPEYIDSDGSIDWLSGTWGKLNYRQEAIPEFGLKEIVATTALGAVLVAAKVVRSKKEWSRREFLRFPKGSE